MEIERDPIVGTWRFRNPKNYEEMRFLDEGISYGTIERIDAITWRNKK